MKARTLWLAAALASAVTAQPALAGLSDCEMVGKVGSVDARSGVIQIDGVTYALTADTMTILAHENAGESPLSYVRRGDEVAYMPAEGRVATLAALCVFPAAP